MKRFLIATTALALSTGAAAAEVNLSGFGYFGIVSDGDVYTDQGIRLEFTGTTKTNAGTEFTAYVRWDTFSGCYIDGTAPVMGANCGFLSGATRARIDVKHDALSLSFGSTHGAMNTLAHVEVGGGFNDWGIAYLSNSTSGQWDDGANVLARYDVGSFSIAASSTMTGSAQEVAVQYSTNGFAIGAGIDTFSNWMLMAGYEMGDLSLTVGTNNFGDAVGGIGYAMGDWDMSLFGAFYGSGGGSQIGLDVGYDLGGGTRLSATAINSSWGGTAIGAGVMFNF